MPDKETYGLLLRQANGRIDMLVRENQRLRQQLKRHGLTPCGAFGKEDDEDLYSIARGRNRR